MIEQKSIQHEKYINLGNLVLTTKKQNWLKLKSMLNDKQIIKLQMDNNQHIPSSQQIKHTEQKINNLQCQITKQPDPRCVWSNIYMLRIFKNGDDTFSQGINEKQQIFKFEFKWKSGQRIQFINLSQRDCIKLRNPITLVRKPQQYIINPWMFYQGYAENYQQFAVQVWVSQLFLDELTKNYEKYQQKMLQSQEQLDEHTLVKIRIRQCMQVQNKNHSFSEIEFLRVLSNIVKKQDIFNEKKQNSKFKCNIGLNNNAIFQNCDSKSLKRCISQQVNFTQQKDNNSVYSFNFTNQNGQAGLFFDLKTGSIVETPKPQKFIGQLKPYQANALTWMLFRQGIGNNCGMDTTHVPYWKNMSSQLNLKQKLFINKNLNFVVYKRNVEKRCNGGILADEMGLGKTIMIIALILAHKPHQNNQTLIIAPLSVIKQWKDQIKKFAPSLRVLIVNQSQINKNKIMQSDVVIVTQGKVKAQLKKQNNRFSIIQHKWFRIVIDQAHNFKNSKTMMAKAIYQLKGKYRWCLTGTPTQNSIGDLFSLLKFLRFTPWCWQSWWQTKFPKDVRKTTSQHFMDMKNLLKGILLRRKKQSVDKNGNNIINLPKVDIKVHVVHLNQEAKLVYKIVDFRAQKTLKSLQRLQQILKNNRISRAKRISLNQLKKIRFQQILGLMVKMRMICCHELLVNYKPNYISNRQFIGEYMKFLAKNKIVRIPKYNFFDYFLATSQQKEMFHKMPAIAKLNEVYQNWDDRLRQISLGMKQQCLKCNQLKQGVLTPCLHVFCKSCVEDHIFENWTTDNMIKRQEHQKLKYFKDKKFKRVNLKDFEGSCPYCQDKLKIRQIIDLPRVNQFNTPIQQYKQNQKIIELLKYINHEMKPDDKALIYTSFLGMMKLIELAFQRQSVTCLTIQGSDGYDVRNQKIEEFNKNPRIKALILTLKTGSVGLNLESANWVFFMDPWWNPAIQEQAIDRAHRMGQIKPVSAIKFITQSTIQARILKLSITKKQMSDSILDIDDVINDQRYSKTRSQIKFLLSVQQQYSESEHDIQKHQEKIDLQYDITKMEKNNMKISQQHLNIKNQLNEMQYEQIDPQQEQNVEQSFSNQQQQNNELNI